MLVTDPNVKNDDEEDSGAEYQEKNTQTYPEINQRWLRAKFRIQLLPNRPGLLNDQNRQTRG